jgi:hypothetical protein
MIEMKKINVNFSESYKTKLTEPRTGSVILDVFNARTLPIAELIKMKPYEGPPPIEIRDIPETFKIDEFFSKLTPDLGKELAYTRISIQDQYDIIASIKDQGGDFVKSFIIKSLEKSCLGAVNFLLHHLSAASPRFYDVSKDLKEDMLKFSIEEAVKENDTKMLKGLITQSTVFTKMTKLAAIHFAFLKARELNKDDVKIALFKDFEGEISASRENLSSVAIALAGKKEWYVVDTLIVHNSPSDFFKTQKKWKISEVARSTILDLLEKRLQEGFSEETMPLLEKLNSIFLKLSQSLSHSG